MLTSSLLRIGITLSLLAPALLLAEPLSNAATPTSDPAAAVASPATAAAAIYQVEFIVLRPRSREDLNAEDWPSTRPALASDHLTDGDYAPAQPLEQTESFSWVPEGSWDFPNTLKRLQESGAYEVLMHRSWRQEAKPRDNATPYVVKLPFDAANYPSSHGGNNYGASIGQAPAGLVGTVSFSKARFLHFSVDLLMTETLNNNVEYSWQSNSQFANDAGHAESLGLAPRPVQPQRHFHLQETRRIKSEVTHYFDHPGFSVLAHVRRTN